MLTEQRLNRLRHRCSSLTGSDDVDAVEATEIIGFVLDRQQVTLPLAAACDGRARLDSAESGLENLYGMLAHGEEVLRVVFHKCGHGRC
jgi:hypothetical protein